MQETTTAELATNFLRAAQPLCARMLNELGVRDSEMAAAVVTALQAGEHLALSFVYDRTAPRIVLESCSDYATRRVIASIELPALPNMEH